MESSKKQLREDSIALAISISDICDGIKSSSVLVNQLVRAASSVGATHLRQKAGTHHGCRLYLFDILEFGGESPRTSRAQCAACRYCHDPLGIVTAEQLDKLGLTYCNTPQLLHR